MAVGILRELLLDDVVTIDALWAIVSPNAKERNVTQEQFDAGFDGKTMDSARDSLWEALAEYYSGPKAEMLRAAVASVKQELAKATQEMAGSTTGNGSTNPKESLATT